MDETNNSPEKDQKDTKDWPDDQSKEENKTRNVNISLGPEQVGAVLLSEKVLI